MIPCRLLACSCHEMQLQSNLPTNYLGLIAKGPTWLFDLLALPIGRLIVSAALSVARCFPVRSFYQVPQGTTALAGRFAFRPSFAGRRCFPSRFRPLFVFFRFRLPSSNTHNKQIILNAVLVCTCDSHRLLNVICLVLTVSVCLQSWSCSRLAPELSRVFLLIVLNKREDRDVIHQLSP